MSSGHAKCCCFLCSEWDSREKYKRYKIKDWPTPGNSGPGENCVRNQQPVEKDRILLPPLHIKLGLMENFV